MKFIKLFDFKTSASLLSLTSSIETKVIKQYLFKVFYGYNSFQFILHLYSLIDISI